MDQIAIELEKREVTGKAVKHLRAQGLVPAVIHDHGKDSLIVMGSYVDLVKAYQKAGKHHPVSLKAGGKQYMALIKKAEFDPKKHMLRHVVFNAVKANQMVDAEVPVRIKLDEDNEATPAERAGLVVLHQLETVEVEAYPKDIPEELTFDGEKLVEVGDHATVADLIVPSGVTVKAEPDHPLATVFEPSALQAANDAAGGTDEEAAEAEEPAGNGEGETATNAAEAKTDGSNDK
ncbi:MAG TPA: 50S ribosomal protein L25 [Candidatus Saccharimonadales bacterium]|nr:50S ribosomal protein L25 [Candidatus Saccharimonadales bacterium]